MRLVTKPPSLAVRGLVQCDAVNPGFQARFSVKTFHSAKHLQEHILRGIRGVSRIADHAVDQAVNRTLKFADQPRIGLFRAVLQVSDNRRFLRPCSNRAGKISQDVTPAVRRVSDAHHTIIGVPASSPTEKSPGCSLGVIGACYQPSLSTIDSEQGWQVPGCKWFICKREGLSNSVALASAKIGAWEIPRPPGQHAGLRDEAGGW